LAIRASRNRQRQSGRIIMTEIPVFDVGTSC
jgi:hypothetical protein